jgi:predicted nucleic acid-binding protein
MKYVLDTNLYVRAFRSEAGAQELQAFYTTFAPVTYLSSVVVHELLVGANTPGKARDIRANVVAPLQRTRRIITPSHSAWEASGEAIARMVRKTKRDVRTVPKSLIHDYLLAASCREAGATLVTENMGDFAEIREYVKVEYRAPWPN